MKQKRTTLFALLGTVVVAGMLYACKPQRGASDGEKPLLTVTVEPQRYFAEAIAGNRFAVASMVPKGASPETYDPLPQQLVALSKSTAYLRIGYIGFEQVWMERLASNAPGLKVFDTSKGIELIHGGHEHAGHAHDVEPHIWNSTVNAQLIARNTCDALCQLSPADSAYFKARCDSLCGRIRQTDSLIRRLLAAPGADKAFMIYHPALSYFARDYGLTQIPIEENGKEPSPARLKALVDTCRNRKVHVVFVQPEFDRHNAEAIAAQTGARIVGINPLSYDWEGEMKRVARTLSNSQ